ncbi:class I SAM-dependent methyltransferase [Pseudomonas sp. MWU13-2105]|uniref:class I SAM-dependent methyltransferase n=1 Tax=Pseudomonas sp. MWU13-2105 TaxID=2935074 RepID=UPI00200F20B2|nr:class I SAM-dependent methyltransferase [Pseudomonas sp. MWU13-2105]
MVRQKTEALSTPDFFLLDEQSRFAAYSIGNKINPPRWRYPSHLREARYSVVLTAGERLETEQICLFPDSRIYIRLAPALPEISTDGLTCTISFLDGQNNVKFTVGMFELLPGNTPATWRVMELDIAWLADKAGKFIIECGPGSAGDPTADWLAVADLCIARATDLKVLLARTHQAIRIKNEIAHFSAAYRNDFYAKVQDQQSLAAQGIKRSVRHLRPTAIQQNYTAEINIPDLEPNAGEDTYRYAMRLLGSAIKDTPPDYKKRLQQMVNTRGKVKVLSICSGAARIEAGFAAAVPSGVEWSLLDINEDLLHMASKQFPAQTSLDLIVADANNLGITGEKWDVIICVSALHHLVELEKVMHFISGSLDTDGEFWSIGEAVGRNGNRLWPDAAIAANAMFSSLPPRYRLNSGSQLTDDAIPDNDHSVGCFEGIRSEEILSLLDCWLMPIQVYRRNCFLWRMIDLAYSNNFNIDAPADRQLIAEMVRAEVQHYRQGGRGAELFGIYGCRHDRGPGPIPRSVPNAHQPLATQITGSI